MKLSTFKQIVSTTVGLGAGSITTQIIKNNVVPGNPITKITVTSAMIVIGFMASEAVGDYTDNMIDQFAEAIQNPQPTTAPTES